MPYKAHPTCLIHEAETGMFEASVTLEGEHGTTCHVVQVPGPISMPFAALRAALIRAAVEQRKSGRFAYRVIREETAGEAAHRRLFSGHSLLDRFLGHAA